MDKFTLFPTGQNLNSTSLCVLCWTKVDHINAFFFFWHKIKWLSWLHFFEFISWSQPSGSFHSDYEKKPENWPETNPSPQRCRTSGILSLDNPGLVTFLKQGSCYSHLRGGSKPVLYHQPHRCVLGWVLYAQSLRWGFFLVIYWGGTPSEEEGWGKQCRLRKKATQGSCLAWKLASTWFHGEALRQKCTAELLSMWGKWVGLVFCTPGRSVIGPWLSLKRGRESPTSVWPRAVLWSRG